MSRLTSILCAVVLFVAAPVCAQQPDLYDETTLRVFDLQFAASNWYQQLQQNFGTGFELAADLTVDGVVYPSVGVRFRGYSSYNSIGSSQKKPFNISMGSFVPGQRLYGYKSLNLNNGFQDPTFVREVLCYHIYRNYMACSKANFVVLRVNGENWGVYINVQQINKDLLREWFVDEDGPRYEADATLPNATSSGAALTWLGTGTTPYSNNYDLKTPNAVAPWVPLIRACDKLNNGPLSTLHDDVISALNVDAAMWMVGAQILFVNPDSYLYFGHNYWLYHDVFHDRMQAIPWGMNMTLAGTFLAGSSYTARMNFNLFYNEGHSGRPLMNRLWAVPKIRERYLAHVRTMAADWWDWSIIGPKVAAYQALIAAEVAADNKKLYPTSAFTSNVTQNYGSGFFSGISGLQPLVNGRRNYLLGHPDLNKPAPFIGTVSHQPNAPAIGQAVWVTAGVNGPFAPLGDVTLYSRTQGAFNEAPMFDDGQHMDGAAGDGVYGAELPAYLPGTRVDYYVGAATDLASGGAMTFFPKYAERAPLRVNLPLGSTGNSITINEFMAKNDNGITDEAGQTEDWIELHNPSPHPVFLDTLCLTDDLNVPQKWRFPPGYLMQPGDTLLVWADNDPADGPLHATFKLSSNGEAIALYDSDVGVFLDNIGFGTQLGDISTGRVIDGSSAFVSFPTATPNALNALSGCGVRSYTAMDSTALDLNLMTPATPAVGLTTSFDVFGGPPGTLHYAIIGSAPAHIAMPATSAVMLVSPPFSPLAIMSDSLGVASYPLTLPTTPSLAGLTIYVQAGVFENGILRGSNALEVIICP
ncbi:MAG: CotH kinase family protein [Planctomycetes bacterium]|nr:CotH kinase family protein [Planctomycetota bacterium]